jgi:hypothetical protein
MQAPNYGTTRVHQLNSIEDRLRLIGEQVDKSQRDPKVRAVALEVVNGAPEHGDASDDEEIIRVFNFVKSNIAYRQDPRDYDMYATGWRTLQLRGGDCDDHTILIAGMLNNLGFLTGAKVISPDGMNWHIYPVAGIRTKASPSAIVPLDTTQPESYPGWEPSVFQRRHEILATFSGGRVHTRTLR